MRNTFWVNPLCSPTNVFCLPSGLFLFFEVPVDHLFASTIFLPYIEQLKTNENLDLVIAAPDTGGTKRANAYAKHLDTDLVICYKQRKKANVIQRSNITFCQHVQLRNHELHNDNIKCAVLLHDRFMCSTWATFIFFLKHDDCKG